jgi:hypothetical protein
MKKIVIVTTYFLVGCICLSSSYNKLNIQEMRSAFGGACSGCDTESGGCDDSDACEYNPVSGYGVKNVGAGGSYRYCNYSLKTGCTLSNYQLCHTYYMCWASEDCSENCSTFQDTRPKTCTVE